MGESKNATEYCDVKRCSVVDRCPCWRILISQSSGFCKGTGSRFFRKVCACELGRRHVSKTAFLIFTISRAINRVNSCFSSLQQDRHFWTQGGNKSGDPGQCKNLHKICFRQNLKYNLHLRIFDPCTPRSSRTARIRVQP